MTAATLSRLERDIAALAGRFAAPEAVLSPLEVARRSGLEPDDWQRDVLESDAQQIILLCSRQSGKSTVTAILATHRAVSVPGSLVLLLAPALRQSQELFRKVKACYAALGDTVPAVVENALSLELTNGSRIVCLPGKEATIRGFSRPALVIEDEASRVPDDLHQAVRPMLAVSRGRLVLLSSPAGRRGHLYETWEHGGPDWLKVKITARDVPRIDPAWLEAERLAIGDWWFDQEYLCDFKDAVDAYFRGVDIEAMADPSIVPLFDRVVAWWCRSTSSPWTWARSTITPRSPSWSGASN
jgi:hypothetical protein